MKLSELKRRAAIQFLGMAVLIGIASALFTYSIMFAQWLCHFMYMRGLWVMFIYTPLVFVVCVYLLKKYFPDADGSGLPQGYAIDIFETKRLNAIYSINSAIGKVVLTFMSVAAGASLGKEGPTIQICSSLFAQIKNISETKRRLLIKLGAGVGVAAAFNTPLGGMMFAVEEYVKKISAKIATWLVGATLLAVFTSNLLLGGNEPYLGRINSLDLHHSAVVIPFAILIGCLCGLVGALFTKLMVFVSANKKWRIHNWRRKHYLINALFFALVVVIIGHLTNGYSFGNGSESNTLFLDHGVDAPWYYAIGKFFGAIASVAAGVPGGYFSTALSIGAGIGDLLHVLLPSTPLIQFYLLGMAGFLAAITQAPLTAVIMVVEMSDSSQYCLPILLASFVASLIAEQFGASVYHQQVVNYIDPSRYKETL